MKPRIEPTFKQHEAWQRLQDKTTEYVVYGGAAGGGKSWLGCEWLLTNCIFYPGTRYFIARQELKDIRESTLITWYKMLAYHKIRSESIATFNGSDLFFKFHNGSRIDLVDLRAKPSDPMYERFGSAEYTAGWIEEAGEVSALGAEMIISRTGRMYNDKYGLLGKTLMTCNPKKNFLYSDYYKPFKNGTLPANKAFIQAFVGDNTKGESGYRQKLEGLTGIARQRLLLGDWEYDDDANSLIEYDKILDCFTNYHLKGADTMYISVDVARKGQDKTVIGLWQGYSVRLFEYEKILTTEITKKIRNLQEKYLISNSNVIVDEDGVGGGVVDQLCCKGFVNNSRPLPNPVNPQLDEKGNLIAENFDNLRSQCYFKLADLINSGRLFIEETEAKEKIIQELEQVKQKDIDSDKKKGVIPKELIKEVIGRSPDYSDTLMMRMYFELKSKFVIAAA